MKMPGVSLGGSAAGEWLEKREGVSLASRGRSWQPRYLITAQYEFAVEGTIPLSCKLKQDIDRPPRFWRPPRGGGVLVLA